MLDSTTSDEVGVISVDLATDSDTSTLSLLASDDDDAQHHPDEMQDHDGATLGAHHTGTVNHQGSSTSDILADTVQDADSGSGSGGGTHLAPVQQLGASDYNDTHFPHPDAVYRRSDANTAAVALAPPHDRMCSTNNCRRFSRFTFTDFEWPACCTLCYSQGSSSHSSTCDASQGTCTTRGCQRRLNSDPLVGWHPVGERFCCVGCIDTAGTRHSATCDATLRSQNDIEPSASHANAPSRPAATLALTLMLSPLPLVPRILVVMLTTFATLTHGAPGTPALAGSGVFGVLLVPPTRCSFVLVLATSTFLSLSNADEQRLPQLPCVTIHVYDPADHFHTVYTVNQASSGHASDPSHLVYGDSDSEAALFRSVYGAANHHEPDSETPHGPHAAQQGPGSPSTLDHPSTQLGDTLTHAVMPTSVDTPAYTSFLHGLLAQMQDETDSESDGSLVPDNWSSDDATPEPHQFPTFHDPGTAHSDQLDEEASDCEGACGSDDSDLRSETDGCADTSDDGNPRINYPTCANYNCNRPSNRPDAPGALCCPRCQPVPHSMHTTSCNRAWIEEMLLDLRHTAPSSRAEPVVARTPMERSLTWATTVALSLALSPLPLSYTIPAIVLAYLTPIVLAAPARLPTPPGFDVDADSGHGSGGGAQSDSRRDRHGTRTTTSATITTDATVAPQSTDNELPAVITLTDILTAGSDGFLTPYDGAQIPCEMPDCPYVASIIAGDFMALCCYDCALYHAHSCSRTPFPLGASAPGGAVSTSIAVPGGYHGGGDNVVAAAAAVGMTSGTLTDIQPPNPCGLLTAAQLAGMARQPGQSASNADVCDIAAAIAASLADLRTATPVATPVLTAPLGVSSSATTAAPAIWDDFSGANVPGPASTHIASLRTLSSARAGQSDLATAHVASLTSLTHADRSDALHLHRISSDAALLATSAEVVVTIYGFIAQATDSLQHLQQQYDDQCTPDSAAALDVARIALTHGLAALHGVLPLSVLLPYGDRYGTPYFTRRDLLLDDPSEQHTLSQRTSSSRRTGPTPMLLLFALVASTIFIAQLSVSATIHTTQPSALAPHGSAASAPSGPTALSPHASAASAPAGPTVLPEGSGIPIQADETRAGVADLSVTARTTGIVRSDTLATNARTRGTGPVPSRRGDEHAMREALHQRRIPFRRSPAQSRRRR